MSWLAKPARSSCALIGLIGTLASAACATTSAPQPAAPSSAAPSAGEPQAASSPRALDARATFADLVRTARSLASSDLAGSSAGCLIGRDGDEYLLAADLMPSLERMPDPPTDLGARFEHGNEAVAVLTAWGVAGPTSATTVLAAFTATSPAALQTPPVLLVLDDERAFVRSSSDGSDASAAELTIQAAVARAKQLTASAGTLYLTATASFSLEQLTSVLALLDASPRTSVALAVLLPTDTALPAARAEVSTELCPTGLPEVDEATPLGDLSREAVTPALAGLHSDIAPCLTSLRVASTRVVIALRIGPTGSVHNTCFMDAGALDPRTASCVLLVAGALQTPAPNPHGVVDLHLPITLETQALPAQRALCAP